VEGGRDRKLEALEKDTQHWVLNQRGINFQDRNARLLKTEH
jgi:hypothetical protein